MQALYHLNHTTSPGFVICKRMGMKVVPPRRAKGKGEVVTLSVSTCIPAKDSLQPI
jgi:ferredoxin-thioredoxin reductase catalytic subunit